MKNEFLLFKPLTALNPLDVCSKIFRNMKLRHSETEKGKNPLLEVTSSVFKYTQSIESPPRQKL